ncbi:MAG TPA: archease [Candidatus Nanoarchaeia archaeon]|nr:archease [Candidatus Nanoarchaeia archaeon]
MKTKKYEFLPHTADIKFKVYGKNLKEIFENSVLAISEISSRHEKVKSRKIERADIEGGDNESLLRGLIEHIIFLFDTENFIVSKAKVRFDKIVRRMDVTFYGDDSKNYKDLDYIKAVTYHDMYVKNPGKNNWVAQVVVDV